jgi:hypothetical protein
VAAFGHLLPPVQAEGELAVEHDLLQEWRKYMNPEEIPMKLTTLAKTFLVAAVAAVTLAVAPVSWAQDKPCSLATVKGAFADKDTGYITGLGSFAGVNLDTFDGKGNMTVSGLVSLNGNIVPNVAKGTYSVNANCTGNYTVKDSQGNAFHAYFVINDGGNELQILVTDPGTAITCIARRQFPVRETD